MQRHRWSFIRVALVTLGLCGGVASGLSAQPAAAETFSATATVKGAQPAVTAPVVVVIDRYSSDEERSKALETLKTGGTVGLRQLLQKMPSIGRVEVGKRQSPIKYAYSRAAGSGRLVTVISDTPLGYLGEKAAGAQPKAGYDLAFALLDVPASGNGTGELGPAVKVKTADGAVVTEDYGAEVVMLTNVAKKP